MDGPLLSTDLSIEDVAGRIDPATRADIARHGSGLTLSSGIPPLTANRFDLAFKLMYLREMGGAASAFAKAAYAAHLHAFSLGTYREPGDGSKSSLDDYTSAFDELFADMDANGFDADRSLVPLARDGSIVNGAHRTASAMVLGRPLATIATDLPPVAYDYRYFRERGVDEVFLDAAALEFMAWTDRCHVALIWPAASGRDAEIDQILGPVVYRKTLQLTATGAHNLLADVYRGEPWLGPQSENFPGVEGKLSGCFPRPGGPVRVILFQADDLEEVRRRKEEVRSLFGLGKHALHITDSREEAERVARLLFNQNGVHFLNFARPNRYPATMADLAHFAATLKAHGVAPGSVAIDGGTVLAVYGLRPSNDIDYLGPQISAGPGIDNHADYLHYHHTSLPVLLGDPRCHFHFAGLKFLALAQVAAMKRARGESKDLADVRLIGPGLAGTQRQSALNAARANVRFHVSGVRSRAVAAIKPKGVWIAHQLGVYPQARSAYKWLRKKLR